MTRIQFGLDCKNLRMAGVSQWKMNKRDARIGRLASPRHNPDLMTGICHQAGVISHDAFNSPNDRRRGVMQKSNSCHYDFSRAACIARSINTAEDQPNMEAAFGGFSPLIG